ncbi:hypothetical protein SSPO_070180 [Streptomyces antimycoticus]|uniref:Uncharacterized protein n=1 Tax=Streptomyces antimycoticus TaxID=68175 RepID=A0A499UUI8_9ACTN|nr:hypothetical protein SSPO_070180 [Streptomyces antimycoticus]
MGRLAQRLRRGGVPVAGHQLDLGAVGPALEDLRGEVVAGARILARMPAAAQYAETEAPPLPELSSMTSGTPRWARSEIITLVPRSLKLPVGLNHSSLNRIRSSPQPFSTSGVHPSPSDTGASMRTGRAAR